MNIKDSSLKVKSIPYIFVAPTITVLILLVIYPFLYGVYVSFFDTNLISRWNFVGFSNYVGILKDATFWKSFAITLEFTIATVIGHFLLGLLLANILNKEIRFRALFRTILLLPWLFPEVVIGNIWKFMFHPANGLINGWLMKLGLISEPISFLGNVNTALGWVIFVCVWKGTPLIMMQLLAGLQTVPVSIREAAVIDGATPTQAFWKVVLPSIKATMFVTVVTDTLWWFKHVTLIWILTQGGPGTATNTISVDIYKRAFEYFNFGSSSAMAVIVFILCAVITVAYKKGLNNEK